MVHVCFAHECTLFFFALDHRLLFKSTAWTRKARDCVPVKLPPTRDWKSVSFHFLLLILLPLLNDNQQAGTIHYLYSVVLQPNFYIVDMYKCIKYCLICLWRLQPKFNGVNEMLCVVMGERLSLTHLLLPCFDPCILSKAFDNAVVNSECVCACVPVCALLYVDGSVMYGN